LPLALRIAAEHALVRPLASIGELVAGLRRQSALRRALTVDEHAQWDEPVLAHSVFAWSYPALPETAATVFRSLSLHPGPDFSEAAVVALAGQTVPGRSPDILVGAHLLERPAGDRYQFHDLVRSYAVDQAREEDPPERRHDATRRLLLWEAIPVRVWCWPGNTNDSALIRQVKKDMRDWSLGRVIWVADRGFTSKENRKFLQQGAGAYIIGEKLRSGSAEAEAALSRQGRYKAVAGNLQVKEV
jgi:hypothetical protein